MSTNQLTTPLADIRDIKPPMVISGGLAWVWWLVLVVAVVAALCLWFWLKNRRSKVVLPPPVPPHLRARRKLEEALALIAQPKPFVIAVSDTTRTYLEERFQFRAPERTTEEFLRELAGTKLLLPDQKAGLGDFLAACDLVKFAKYEPGEPELRQLHGSALRLIEETEPQPLVSPDAALAAPNPPSLVQHPS
jgi:hypothetical protein